MTQSELNRIVARRDRAVARAEARDKRRARERAERRELLEARATVRTFRELPRSAPLPDPRPGRVYPVAYTGRLIHHP